MVTTNDSGKAVFTVKSIDGEKDTVKVTFDVAGDFGTHSEGSITFRKAEENTYNLSGHIVETYEFEHSYDPSRYEENEYTKYDIIKAGKVKVTIEYDIEGTISWTKAGSLSGEVGYKNITAKRSKPWMTSKIHKMFYQKMNLLKRQRVRCYVMHGPQDAENVK